MTMSANAPSFCEAVLVSLTGSTYGGSIAVYAPERRAILRSAIHVTGSFCYLFTGYCV